VAVPALAAVALVELAVRAVAEVVVLVAVGEVAVQAGRVAEDEITDPESARALTETA
jgi:hypothetical protein